MGINFKTLCLKYLGVELEDGKCSLKEKLGKVM